MKAAFVFLVSMVFLEVFLDASPAQNGPWKHRNVKHKIRPRIFNGKVVRPGEFPYMALFTDGYLELQVYCGGALISEEYVLTTADCLESYDYDEEAIIHLGEHDIENDTETVHQSLNGEEFLVHPKYNSHNLRNNIALVKLDKPANLSDTNLINTICLFNGSVDSLHGEAGTVTGWGETEEYFSSSVLRKLDVRLISNEECKANFSDVHASLVYKEDLCAANEQGNYCEGDEGGPLVVNRNGQNQLVGLASWVYDCEDPHPGIYVSVASYANWIMKTTKNTATVCS